MNIKYLWELAKSNPALARAINIALLGGVGYILGVLITGEPFSLQALIWVGLTPLLAFFDKRKRDLDKTNK